MAPDPPIPPKSLGLRMIDTLNESSPEELRTIAEYAGKLAEHEERERRLEVADDEGNSEDLDDDLPDDVPGRATITIQEINDNRYYYWQWREGEKVKSQYKGPVNPDD